MEINYNITEETYMEFYLFQAKNSKAIRKSMMTQRFLTPLLYLVGAVIVSYILDMHLSIMGIPFLIFGFLWMLFFPVHFNRQIKRTARKMIREGKNEGVLGKHSMVFTDEGLKETNATGETKVAWVWIQDLKEDESNFYLYHTGITGFIVPKKDLMNVDDIRSLLQDKISTHR